MFKSGQNQNLTFALNDKEKEILDNTADYTIREYFLDNGWDVQISKGFICFFNNKTHLFLPLDKSHAHYSLFKEKIIIYLAEKNKKSILAVLIDINKTELCSCPYCDSKPTILNYYNLQRNNKKNFQISCTCCKKLSSKRYYYLRDAVLDWNIKCNNVVSTNI